MLGLVFGFVLLIDLIALQYLSSLRWTAVKLSIGESSVYLMANLTTIPDSVKLCNTLTWNYQVRR